MVEFCFDHAIFYIVFHVVQTFKQGIDFMEESLVYYVRQGHIPVGCVAISLNDDGTIDRGVSYCSRKDNFSKKKGRNLALARLAIARKGIDVKFGEYQGNKRPGLVVVDRFEFCAAHKALPTKFEERMLYKPENL